MEFYFLGIIGFTIGGLLVALLFAMRRQEPTPIELMINHPTSEAERICDDIYDKIDDGDWDLATGGEIVEELKRLLHIPNDEEPEGAEND